MAWTTVLNDNFGGYLYLSYDFSKDTTNRKWSFSIRLKVSVPAGMAYGSWIDTGANSANLTGGGLDFIDNRQGSEEYLVTLAGPITRNGDYDALGTAPSVTVSWAWNVNSSWAGYQNPSGSTTLTGESMDPKYYTVTLNKNEGSGGSNTVSIAHGTKKGSYPTITLPSRSGHSFNGYWTSASGGDQYYDSNGNSIRDFNNATQTWYAHWIALGSYINVKANNYFTKNESSIAEYVDSYDNRNYTYTFVNSGNDNNKAYPDPAKQALINQTDCNYALFSAPYYDSNQVEFLGYYTGRYFNQDNNVQVYAPTNWIYNATRTHVAKAISGDGVTFFNNNTELKSDPSISVWQNQEVRIENDFIIPIPDSNFGVTNISLPKWNQSDGQTYTFWAMWANKNLTFTLDPDNGTNNEAHVEHIGLTGFETGKVKDYTFPSLADINTFNYTPKIGRYPNGTWYIHPEATRGNEMPLIIAPLTKINFGQYILDTTFYAGWSPFIHALKISFDGTTENLINFMTIQGGENIYDYHSYNNNTLLSLVNAYKTQHGMEDAIFYGLYTKKIGGKRVFEADGSPNNNGTHFIDNMWAYRTESTDPNTEVVLYAHWVPDTNAKMNISSDPNNPQWRYGFIYINKNANNPNLAPDWEQVPEVTFIKN